MVCYASATKESNKFNRYPILPLCFPLCSAFFFVWCGDRVKDKFTGQSYEHRRGWVEERLLFLSSVFSIDSAATVSVLMR